MTLKEEALVDLKLLKIETDEGSFVKYEDIEQVIKELCNNYEYNEMQSEIAAYKQYKKDNRRY